MPIVHSKGHKIWSAIALGQVQEVREYFPPDGSSSPDVFLLESEKVTPLFIACFHGHLELAQYFIQLGANVSEITFHFTHGRQISF